MNCRACCPNCFMTPTPVTSSTEPTALQNLLPVGTIFLPLSAAAEQGVCDHQHAEDGWHYFQEDKFVGLFSKQEDVSFCHNLQFLIDHGFVRATHQNNANGYVSVRVYLVPDDLPGTLGRLRSQPQRVLPTVRRHLQTLLPKIITHHLLWAGMQFDKIPTPEVQTLLPDCKDTFRTLAEIYGDVPSPNPSPVPGYGEIATRLLNSNDDLEGLGMRSKLHMYQRRSVAAMLQKESDPRQLPNPLFIQLSTVDSNTFYLQPGTMEVLLQRPFTAPPRGGILCEELGTGKTVMVLGLICATSRQISSPEPSVVESRPVLTPLAFRHFPSDDYIAARQQLGVKYRNSILGPQKERVPSLVELLVHRAREAPRCDVPADMTSKAYERQQQIIDNILNSHMSKFIHDNVPFYHQWKMEPRPNSVRSKRITPYPGPKALFLTSATLVVVPATLASQWDREIIKHCDDSLRVLSLRTTTPLPSVQSLATDYDIILITSTRFMSESRRDNVEKLHERRLCKCREHLFFRVPVCICAPIEDVSPLLRIRWKRLVVDEGHVSSHTTTSLVTFSKMLSVESKWIVTGTPTTNLMGLSFGSKSVEDAGATDVAEEHSLVDTTPGLPAFQSSHRQDSVQTHAMTQLAEQPSPTNPNSRKWDEQDRKDLNKLGDMITHFICVPQFHANPKLVRTHIVEPLLDPMGPRGGSIDVLTQVMEMVMIRHRIEDVEKDVILPPVTQESVLLDLDPLVIKSFNALQAILTINAVDTQRKGLDYMFHPRNTDALAETMRNMSQILFWHIDSDKYNAPTLVREAQIIMQRAIDRKMPSADVEGLRAALHHLKIALDDPLWVQIQAHEDVVYRVFDLQKEIFASWSRTRHCESNASDSQTGLMHADRLLRMHDLIVKRPLMSTTTIAEWGQRLTEYDQKQRDACEKAAAKQNRRRSSHPIKNSDSEALQPNPPVDKFAKKAVSSKTLQEMQNELGDCLRKLELGRIDDGDVDDEERHDTTAGGSPSGQFCESRPIFASSQLAKVRIGSSASTKINYIINEVKMHSKTEKFLIFSASPLSLAHVAEALELTHVKFLRFTTEILANLREQLVLTFETSERYRVFLMELKHGARGLNLISASRVIFCEPVWHADVESQAIKRVHRIGQKRPINVKILAIRDTAEEHMVSRRSALRGSQGKLPKLLEEKGMRDYIQNPTFITCRPTPALVPPFPLLNLPPESLQPCPEAVTPEMPLLHSLPSKRPMSSRPPCDDNKEPEQKKRKLTVTFA